MDKADTLVQKINKYKDMAATMLVKEKELEAKNKNKTVLSRMGFGFPERPNTKPPNLSIVREVAPKKKVPNRNSLPDSSKD